jgi:hypothetical protein
MALFSGSWGLLPGVKRAGREADHTFLSGVEIMNEWNTSTHLVCLHDVYRDKFPPA